MDDVAGADKTSWGLRRRHALPRRLARAIRDRCVRPGWATPPTSRCPKTHLGPRASESAFSVSSAARAMRRRSGKRPCDFQMIAEGCRQLLFMTLHSAHSTRRSRPRPPRVAALSQPHDALFKWAFSQHRHAVGLLKAALPRKLAAATAWSTLRLENGSMGWLRSRCWCSALGVLSSAGRSSARTSPAPCQRRSLVPLAPGSSRPGPVPRLAQSQCIGFGAARRLPPSQCIGS